MNRSRITDDMFARVPALLLEGMTKAEIAAIYGVTPGTLVCMVTGGGHSKAHMKLMFERIERNLHRCHFASLNVIVTRWHGLIARNPYRPELHYMRGPGPKWYAKRQGDGHREPGATGSLRAVILPEVEVS